MNHGWREALRGSACQRGFMEHNTVIRCEGVQRSPEGCWPTVTSARRTPQRVQRIFGDSDGTGMS